MAKALEVNDNTAQNQERHPQQQSGDKRNQQKLQGKAFQVTKTAWKTKSPPGHQRRHGEDDRGREESESTDGRVAACFHTSYSKRRSVALAHASSVINPLSNRREFRARLGAGQIAGKRRMANQCRPVT